MNAFAMKLENRQQLTISNEEKSKDLTGLKRCKSVKKKNISSTDKDALLNSNGLGRKFSDNSDLNSLSSNASMKYDFSKKNRSKKVCLKVDKMFTETDKIQEKLQRSLSNEDKEKILSILNEIRALSDVEKLYLYLQLPTGSSFEVDPFRQKNVNPLGKKADEEGMFAVTWIQSHLEEDPDVSLPKQEVYDEYQSYCSMTGTDPLCAADFGKVMKQIFPSVKPRRLGTRGNSRYCYSGMRKKIKLVPPSVPDIQKEKENYSSTENVGGDEVTAAACHLLFEWAEKLLGIKFSSLKELAAHLLENMYVDNRSVAAFTVLLDASPQLLSKGFTVKEGGVKKTEAQFHLQRKIQEKELIKEQKRKLQEQRTSVVSASKGKGAAIPCKKKNPKSRKNRLSTDVDDLGCEDEKPEVNLQDPVKSNDKNDEKSDLKKCEEIILQVKKSEFSETHSDAIVTELNIKQEEICPKSQPSEVTEVVEPPMSSLLKSNPSSVVGDAEDSVKRKGKIMIPQKPPVCIAPSLPGIIIVPSLPQITAEVGKQSASPPKYKRIQPKPLQGEAFRSRAGSVGSSIPNKPQNTRSLEGRRSSHAWLQSGFGELDEKSFQNGDTPAKSIEEKRNGLALKDSIRYEMPPHGSNMSFTETISNGNDVLFDKRKRISELNAKPRLIVQSGNQVNNSEAEDSNSAKRHLDEKDDHTDNKRFHLDLSKLSSESVWVPNTTDTSNQSNAQILNNNKHAGMGHEEVNVHEIEGDALNDYFRGANNQSCIGSSLQQNELEQQLASTSKVRQLSQLRMLLEQNLPSAISKMTPSSVKIQKVSKSVDTAESSLSALSLGDVKKQFLPVLQDANRTVISNSVYENPANPPGVANSSSAALKNDPQLENLEKFLSSTYLTTEAEANMDSGQLLSDPSMFLNCSQNSIQEMDVSLPNCFEPDASVMNMLSNALVEPISAAVTYGRVSTCTQVPSVPQSPNTRRRAFNFMPISPRHTPVPDGLPVSDIPQFRTMMSTAVGPSQPPSNSGSPFVSPRSTPVPLCRSRHSSGQSTSRHTPFQNFDSGVSSVSSSPFISPQPTPVPVSRLRHNSSHGSSKTVTFSSTNSPQVIHTHSNLSNNSLLRTRHNSGPGAAHIIVATSPRSSSLSPLVSEQSSVMQPFMFPSNNEARSRHSSGSNATTPLSPVSEQASSSSSCASNMPDLSGVTDAPASHSFLNDAAGDLLISANPSNFRQVRHRHASGSVIYGKSYAKDVFSQEIQKLLKNSQDNCTSDLLLTSNRSQSVPLHQMLQTADGFCFLAQPVEDSKSHPSTPVMNQMFSFPTTMNGTSQELNASLSLAMDINNRDSKSIIQNSQMEWTGFDGSAELEASGSARRNLAALYDAPPLMDDLQTTLEDLRDCDTDFSKLELELRQSEESGL